MGAIVIKMHNLIYAHLGKKYTTMNLYVIAVTAVQNNALMIFNYGK